MPPTRSPGWTGWCSNSAQPAIARASALLLLPAYATPASDQALLSALGDPSALVRAAAPRALTDAASQPVLQAAMALLTDPVRAVRIEAARALAGADPGSLTSGQRAALDIATSELVAAELVDAERPEAHLNLGLLDLRRGRAAEAEAEYQTALRLDPAFVPAMVNLADLDRMRGRDAEGVALLRRAVAIEPRNADVRHALGLLLVRQRNYTAAVAELRQASELAPDNARYAYVYAIALSSTGSPGPAMDLLERVHQQHPADREVLGALVSMASDAGDFPRALRHARALLALTPDDAQLGSLVRELERRQGG